MIGSAGELAQFLLAAQRKQAGNLDPTTMKNPLACAARLVRRWHDVEAHRRA
jgi:hypothetical protein